MNLLLDTHTFIWTFREPNKLSSAAVDAISDANNTSFISVVTIWEMQIKTALGKMDLGDTLRNIVIEQIANGFNILDFNLDHALAVESLPVNPKHKDPFDRLLISQAMVEDMTIITIDEHFADYTVKVLW
jgi:PIN domain nuclease of toxin-antitoxin system